MALLNDFKLSFECNHDHDGSLRVMEVVEMFSNHVSVWHAPFNLRKLPCHVLRSVPLPLGIMHYVTTSNFSKAQVASRARASTSRIWRRTHFIPCITSLPFLRQIKRGPTILKAHHGSLGRKARPIHILADVPYDVV